MASITSIPIDKNDKRLPSQTKFRLTNEIPEGIVSRRITNIHILYSGTVQFSEERVCAGIVENEKQFGTYKTPNFGYETFCDRLRYEGNIYIL